MLRTMFEWMYRRAYRHMHLDHSLGKHLNHRGMMDHRACSTWGKELSPTSSHLLYSLTTDLLIRPLEMPLGVDIC